MNELKKEIRRSGTSNSLMILIFMVLATSLSALIGYIVESLVSVSDEYMDSVYTLIVCIVQYLVVVPFVIAVYCRIKKQKFIETQKKLFVKPQAKTSSVIKWIIIGLSLTHIASYCSSFLISFIKEITNNSVSDISLAAESNVIGYIANIAGMFLLAPFFEELLFRGNFFKGIEKYGSWFAVVITGITFGLWHVNIGQTLYTIVLGICTAFLIAKTKSIIPSICMHGFFNLIGTIQSIAVSGFDTEQADNVSYLMEHFGTIMIMGFVMILNFSIIVIGLIFFIIEITKHKDTFVLPKSDVSIPVSQKLSAYFLSPISVITYLCLIGFTVFNAISG